MKNIFFSLLILSSSFIYSTGLKINVKKKEKLQPLHKKQISSLSRDEEYMDLDIEELEREEVFLKDITGNQRSSVDGWNVVKGLAGLWLGTKFFFCGSKGVIVSLMFHDRIMSEMISRSSTTLSPVEKFLTNRFLWLSVSGTLTVFSLWILKKSATNLYKGLYPTENNMEYFGKDL